MMKKPRVLVENEGNGNPSSSSSSSSSSSASWSIHPWDLPFQCDCMNEETLNLTYLQQHQHQQQQQQEEVLGSSSSSSSSCSSSSSGWSAHPHYHQRSRSSNSSLPSICSASSSSLPPSALDSSDLSSSPSAHTNPGWTSGLCALPEDSWHVSHHNYSSSMSNNPFSRWIPDVSKKEEELVSSSFSSLLSSHGQHSYVTSLERFKQDCCIASLSAASDTTSSLSSSRSGFNPTLRHHVTPSPIDMQCIQSKSSSPLEMHHMTTPLSSDMHHIKSSSLPLEMHHITPSSPASSEIHGDLTPPSSSSSPRLEMYHIPPSLSPSPSPSAAIHGLDRDRNSPSPVNETSTKRYGFNFSHVQGNRPSFHSTHFSSSSRDKIELPLMVNNESSTQTHGLNSCASFTSWRDNKTPPVVNNESRMNKSCGLDSNMEHNESSATLPLMTKGSIMLQRWKPVLGIWCVIVIVMILLLLLPLVLPPLPPPPLGLLFVPVIILFLLICQAISSPNLNSTQGQSSFCHQ